MNTLQLTREAVETARARRIQLSTRALLGALVRTAACATRAAFRLRSLIDPAGGAYDHTLART